MRANPALKRVAAKARRPLTQRCECPLFKTLTVRNGHRVRSRVLKKQPFKLIPEPTTGQHPIAVIA